MKAVNFHGINIVLEHVVAFHQSGYLSPFTTIWFHILFIGGGERQLPVDSEGKAKEYALELTELLKQIKPANQIA